MLPFWVRRTMPLVKLTCPHCGATLKPGRPVPEGRTVKCPKCSETFQAGEELPEATAAPSSPAAAATSKSHDDDGTYAVIKEETDREEEPVRRKKKRRKDDEDEDEEDDEDEDEEGKPDIIQEYLKNLKSKDPRGPAQAQVVSPSNWLLRSGLIGFFGWAITFIVFMIPVAFPNIEDKEDKGKSSPSASQEKDKKKVEGGKKDEISLAMVLEEPLHIVLFVAVLLLGLAHGGLIAVGAVKMQSLESYGWGMVSAILTILPLHMLPFFWLFWSICDFIMDEMGWAFALIVFLAGPGVGIPCMMVLRKPEVKAGFEYKPE
jgi:hypothetical protein